MDAVELTILERELAADAEVLKEASNKARLRLTERAPGFSEACAYELARFYTVIEKSFERICSACENHFAKDHEYHERLLQRITLDLPGLRPAFVPRAEIDGLRELKGFRHVVRHAYNLTLRPARLEELASIAELAATNLPTWTSAFAASIRREQGWGS
jgi:hypothetical protein